MRTTRLREHSAAQCHVIEEGNKIHFISYVTRVITITRENGKRFVECTGTYSKTTIKQIGWFLREYAPDLSYYQMKDIVGKGAVEI